MGSYELVVVSYRSRDHIAAMLAALPEALPVVIVDNAGGCDGLLEFAALRPNCRYLDGGGRGFAHGANLGAMTSEHEVVIFVNPDARPTLDVLDALADDVLQDGLCASSAAMTVGPDGLAEIGVAGWEPSMPRALVHAFGMHKVAPRAGLFARPRLGERLSVDWTSGPCMAVRHDTFEALGGWDERFFVYSEDVAFGRSAREHGLYQRLRTDLPVPHASGGSGAPSLEMMQLRGASMALYLRDHRRRSSSRVIIAALAAGYLVRAAQQRLQGNVPRSREHLAYVRGVLTGRAFVAGRQVASLAPATR